MKCLLAVTFVVTIIGISSIVYKNNEKREAERRLEARFDKFMGSYYPYLNDLSDAAAIYKLMQTSLMYDYLAYHKGRYINENVTYYFGGSFSMRDHFELENFLGKAKMLYICRAYGPIDTAPPSREEDKKSCFRIIKSIEQLLDVDIYDENIDYGTENLKRDLLDSLNLEIQSNFLKLIKYKVSGPRIDMNAISEFDYDIKNY